jgi:hypothetical protein
MLLEYGEQSSHYTVFMMADTERQERTLVRSPDTLEMELTSLKLWSRNTEGCR